MQNQQKTKIEWLSILQGWSMLLVVIGHVVLTDNMFDDKYPPSYKLIQYRFKPISKLLICHRPEMRRKTHGNHNPKHKIRDIKKSQLFYP